MEGWDDFLRDQETVRSTVRKQHKLSDDRLRKIRSSSLTRRINYPEYQEAFDYVDKLYPFVNIKKANVYHTSSAILFEVGYVGMGGFYDIGNRVVVITDQYPSANIGGAALNAEFTTDEVLCHELIHYCANFKNNASTRECEEEIAYGKSINYLRMKGRTDDFIIRKNMMPYLISVIDRKAVIHRVLTQRYNVATLHSMSKEGIQALLEQEYAAFRKELIADAYKLGERMIALYGDKIDTAPLVKPRPRQLDLDDDF